jgi:stage IV sporulation protein FB
LMVGFFVNYYWTIINLMPVVPLDGGRLMTILFEGLFGLRGVKVALFLSIIFGVLLSALAFYIGQLYVGAFFVLFVFESYREWNASLAITSHDKDLETQLSLKEAQNAISSGNFDLGLAKLQSIRDKVKKGRLYIAATVGMGELLAQQGKTNEAYGLLSELKSRLPPDKCVLMQTLAYNNKDWNGVIQNGTKAYQYRPDYEIALTNALAYANMDDVKPAVGWIQRAIKDGLPNIRAVLMKTEFDGIRNSELFRSLDASA